jgi:hypothetical protein
MSWACPCERGNSQSHVAEDTGAIVADKPAFHGRAEDRREENSEEQAQEQHPQWYGLVHPVRALRIIRRQIRTSTRGVATRFDMPSESRAAF